MEDNKEEIDRKIAEYAKANQLSAGEKTIYPGDLVFDVIGKQLLICGDDFKDVRDLRVRNSTYRKVEVKELVRFLSLNSDEKPDFKEVAEEILQKNEGGNINLWPVDDNSAEREYYISVVKIGLIAGYNMGLQAQQAVIDKLKQNKSNDPKGKWRCPHCEEETGCSCPPK